MRQDSGLHGVQRALHARIEIDLVVTYLPLEYEFEYARCPVVDVVGHEIRAIGNEGVDV